MGVAEGGLIEERYSVGCVIAVTFVLFFSGGSGVLLWE